MRCPHVATTQIDNDHKKRKSLRYRGTYAHSCTYSRIQANPICPYIGEGIKRFDSMFNIAQNDNKWLMVLIDIHSEIANNETD